MVMTFPWMIATDSVRAQAAFDSQRVANPTATSRIFILVPGVGGAGGRDSPPHPRSYRWESTTVLDGVRRGAPVEPGSRARPLMRLVERLGIEQAPIEHDPADAIGIPDVLERVPIEHLEVGQLS